MINFFDWPEEEAKLYPDCYGIVERVVKPERQRWAKDELGNEIVGEYALRKPLPDKWWIYADKRPALYRTIVPLERVLTVAQVAKYQGFFFVPNGYVYSMMNIVFSISRYSEFLTLQSVMHDEWTRKYGSSLESRQRYTPSDCFETFPFPQNLEEEREQLLDRIGEAYHEHRRKMMLDVQLGLTKTYNLFHSNELRPITSAEEALDDKAFEKQFGKEAARLRKHLASIPGTISFNEAIAGILKLRNLHKEMDQAVLEAYGWSDIQLRHEFYEVDYLPENDRTRFTIHPDARKEVLKRLLELNHKIHEEEVRAEATGSKVMGASKKGKRSKPEKQIKLL